MGAVKRLVNALSAVGRTYTRRSATSSLSPSPRTYTPYPGGPRSVPLGGSAPSGGIVYQPFDQGAGGMSARWISDALNPESLKRLIRASESGDLSTTLQLFGELEAKDLRLHSLANTRRSALTGLDWQVVPDPVLGDDAEDEATKYVADRLRKLKSFPFALEHLATAIGPNLAVCELVWDKGELVEIIPIPSERITANPRDPREVWIVTKEAQQGEPLEPGKWIVHVPSPKARLPWTNSLSSATAVVWLIKTLCLGNWSAYSEIFGMPIRWATYPLNTTETEKKLLGTWLANMGTAGWGVFSEAVKMQVLESGSRQGQPYEAQVEWCERTMAIGWLGQTLTTDTTGATGTLASAKIHDQVREDLLLDDAKKEARCVDSQIIAPMVGFRFPNRSPDDPLPMFRRIFKENVDRKLEIEVIAAAQNAGVAVPRQWAYERLSIPMPDEGDEVLEPVGARNPFAEEGPL